MRHPLIQRVEGRLRRLARCSLARMLLALDRTVRSLITNWSAISWLESPYAGCRSQVAGGVISRHATCDGL